MNRYGKFGEQVRLRIGMECSENRSVGTIVYYSSIIHAVFCLRVLRNLISTFKNRHYVFDPERPVHVDG